MLVAVGLGGIDIVMSNGVNRFDRSVFSLLAPQPSSVPWQVVANVGNPIVVAAVACAGALAVWLRRHDGPGAFACLFGAALAGVLTEYVLKPLVDSQISSGYQYPSGHTTGIAVVCAVAVLVQPAWRRVLGALGAVLLILGSLAVVVLRWHTPSAALAGVLVGIGAVLFALGLARLLETDSPVRLWTVPGNAQEELRSNPAPTGNLELQSNERESGRM
jgi:membrane-associated phospholipid phosphatase